MLALTRKEGERIILTVGGHQITLMVNEARSGTARLGIEAPAAVKIVREELLTQSPQHVAGGRE